MIDKIDVEKFLINKYGVECLNYTGFKYIRDIIMNNEDYIAGKTMRELSKIAHEYHIHTHAVERAIRHFKSKVTGETEPNTVFLNNLIFECKEHIRNKNA